MTATLALSVICNTWPPGAYEQQRPRVVLLECQPYVMLAAPPIFYHTANLQSDKGAAPPDGRRDRRGRRHTRRAGPAAEEPGAAAGWHLHHAGAITRMLPAAYCTRLLSSQPDRGGFPLT